MLFHRAEHAHQLRLFTRPTLLALLVLVAPPPPPPPLSSVFVFFCYQQTSPPPPTLPWSAVNRQRSLTRIISPRDDVTLSGLSLACFAASHSPAYPSSLLQNRKMPLTMSSGLNGHRDLKIPNSDHVAAARPAAAAPLQKATSVF